MPSKLKDMREKVLKELSYIPKTSEPQSELRAIYWIKRMHSLGKKAKSIKTAPEVLKECIDYLQKEYPKYEFIYDKKYFH